MGEAESAAWSALQRFQVRGMPADSLDEHGQVRDLITPNPYFCFGVGLDLGAEVERSMRRMGRRQLAGSQGILTLAPEDWGRVFSAEFLSDRRHVRGRRMRSIGKFNYHRGVEWNWLSQFFVQAELKYGEPGVAFRRYLRAQVNAALDRGGVGGISELYDLSGTRGPEFQAWSMAGFLESLHAFAGVRIDVPERRIVVDPQLPEEWPLLSVRKWYGSVPFDIRYRREPDGIALTIEFPWGEAPDAQIDLSLVLPARHAVAYLDICLDAEPQAPDWITQQIPGTDQTRMRVSLPAGVRLDITAQWKRAAGRAALSA
jgi:hypothetical protein